MIKSTLYIGRKSYLAKKQLIGKVHLTSDMEADDTEREI